MNQTTVDWLTKQFISFLTIDSPIKHDMINEVVKQAKEMEKEQIAVAYDRGYIDGYVDNGKVGLDYYNETYG